MVILPVRWPDRRSRAGVFANIPHMVVLLSRLELGRWLFNPATDSCSRFAYCFECIEIDPFVFERLPEPLHHDIAHPASFAVHRNFDAGILEYAGKRIACKQTAPIGVKDLGPAIALQGLFKDGNTKIGILGIY